MNIGILRVIGCSHLKSLMYDRYSTLSAVSSSLQILDLSNNSLSFESQDERHAFSHLSDLKVLNLSYNKIEETNILIDALEYLKNLKSLYLNNNRELKFNGNGFPASLQQLEFLDLSYCHVFEPTDVIFNNLV
uniref:Uncharacterized protein n=1 Tax=Panagrolaimus superbus TaxID=310955 RepID=A0A914YGD4_9BILA